MQKKFTLILSPLILFVLYITQSSYSGGIAGVSSGCTCHGANSGNTSVTLSGLPAGGYSNGVVYPLTISVTNNAITPFTGTGASGLRDGFTLLSNGGTVAAALGMNINGAATEIRHNTPRAPISGTASWTFNWTAPATGSATVNFTMSGNATNGSNNNTGDQWNFYTTSVAKAATPVFVSASASTILCSGNLSNITATGSGGSGLLQYRLNGGAYQSSGLFINNAVGMYTITVKDALNTTASSTVSIVQPTALSVNAANITHPICNNGSGGISILVIGGVGTKTYSITPSGPQTNTTGNFSNLMAQAYSITAVDINNCSLSTVLTVTQPPPLVVTSSNVSGCEAHPIPLIGTPAGGQFSVPDPYLGPSATYTYSYTAVNGCVGVSSPSTINVVPLTPNIIIQTVSGNACETLTGTGVTKFSNSNCELMLSLNISGLGAVTTCVSFLPGNPSWNGEPYANRVYSINPSVQPTAPKDVCLYYTASDLLSAGITNPSDISITKVDGNGVLGGTGMVSEIANTSMTINQLFGGITEVCFSVNSFSSFYLHSKNPNNIPLPVSLHYFKGEPKGRTDLLNWQTLAEKNHASFNILQSKNGLLFEQIGSIESNSIDGESNIPLNYSFEGNHLSAANNYYQLELVDKFGNKTYSEIISLSNNEIEMSFQVSPNPSNGLFFIRSEEPVNMNIYNLSGACVLTKQNIQNTTIELKKAGIYLLRLSKRNGQTFSRRIIVI